MPDKPIIKVAAKAAIMNSGGQVLIVRESTSGDDNTKSGYWGLVGGRLEPGETFMDGLKREVTEETGLKIEVNKPLYVGEWRPIIRGVEHQIIAVFMLCHTISDKVNISTEHDAYKWIMPGDRHKYKMMEPDCFAVDAASS